MFVNKKVSQEWTLHSDFSEMVQIFKLKIKITMLCHNFTNLHILLSFPVMFSYNSWKFISSVASRSFSNLHWSESSASSVPMSHSPYSYFVFLFLAWHIVYIANYWPLMSSFTAFGPSWNKPYLFHFLYLGSNA